MSEDNAKRTDAMNSIYADARELLGEDFFQEIAGLLPLNGPRIDVYETPGKVFVLAELPGLASPDQIGMTLDGTTLVMEGEIPCPYPVTENRIRQRERFFGAFRRTLSIPGSIKADCIVARYHGGLLTIELEIDPDQRPSRITVDFA